MKSDDYEALSWEGQAYCVDCLPPEVKEKATPILAEHKVDVYPACCICQKVHSYLDLTEYGQRQVTKDFEPLDIQKMWVAGQLPAHAEGYPMVYIGGDAVILCPACASKRYLAETRKEAIIAWFIHYEGPAVSCEECDAVIESSYGDPESEKPNEDLLVDEKLSTDHSPGNPQ